MSGFVFLINKINNIPNKLKIHNAPKTDTSKRLLKKIQDKIIIKNAKYLNITLNAVYKYNPAKSVSAIAVSIFLL